MNNKWVSNLINIFGVYAPIFIILFTLGRLEDLYTKDGGFIHPFATLSIIFSKYFFLGLILGAENFINEIKKEGKWKINILRIIAFGVPSLIFSLFNPLTNRIIDGTEILNLLGKIIINAPDIVTYSQVFLSYILITSFYKSNINITD